MLTHPSVFLVRLKGIGWWVICATTPALTANPPHLPPNRSSHSTSSYCHLFSHEPPSAVLETTPRHSDKPPSTCATSPPHPIPRGRPSPPVKLPCTSTEYSAARRGDGHTSKSVTQITTQPVRLSQKLLVTGKQTPCTRHARHTVPKLLAVE